ncbi:ATP-binding protein [Maridesulfovibrio bastinii]|uniref:ATP-binding protein n=1 Tax=Maridesulfovibrio bastinii TaxID=47157 RepID=UPI00040D278C|nr:ATP-binding protein [Maridesulfovibrio bastinii]
MNLLGRLRFRTKINIGITVIVVMTALILAMFVTRMASDALVQEARKRGRVLTGNLVLRSVDPLLSVDLLQLKTMVDEITEVDSDVVYAFIEDERGRILVHTFSDGFPVELINANKVQSGSRMNIVTIDTGKEKIYDFAAPVYLVGKKIGTVRLGLSRTKVQQVTNSLILAISMLTGLALAMAVLVSTQFAKRITARIGMLREHAENLVKGNLVVNRDKKTVNTCHEIRNCGKRDCPAWQDNLRRCWYISGTKCPECGENNYPDKLTNCRNCDIYINSSGDEIQELTETFDVMANTLKYHIEDLETAQKNILRQQKLLQTILSVSPDQVSLVGTDLTYMAVNAAFARSCGKKEEEIMGMRDEDLFNEEISNKRKQEVISIFSTGKIINKENLYQPEDGDPAQWFHTIRVPVYDEDQNITGVLSTARDITELKSYQSQLIQSQKMESVGKLAGGVAHEINTPLGIILGYAQLLQEDVDPESQIYADLGIMEKQARFCRKIVADLLGFSRQTTSDKIEMCFNNSILEVVQLVTHTFKLENVSIITDLDDRYPIIQGDPEKLKQVWLNLLSNALEAMNGGGIVKIITRLDTQDMTITAFFADSGYGIAKKNLNSIFDPFFSTKPVGKGTGLGLSVSFGIIEDHGGKISVTSPLPEGILEEELPEEAGPGTLFTITLPLEPGKEKEILSSEF